MLHLELIWGTPIDFAFLRRHQCSLVVPVFLGILFSSIREIEVPYICDREHGTPQNKWQGNRASSAARGSLMCFSRVAAGTWCIISSYGRDGHLKLGYVQRSQDSCQVMMETSGS